MLIKTARKLAPLQKPLNHTTEGHSTPLKLPQTESHKVLEASRRTACPEVLRYTHLPPFQPVATAPSLLYPAFVESERHGSPTAPAYLQHRKPESSCLASPQTPFRIYDPLASISSTLQYSSTESDGAAGKPPSTRTITPEFSSMSRSKENHKVIEKARRDSEKRYYDKFEEILVNVGGDPIRKCSKGFVPKIQKLKAMARVVQEQHLRAISAEYEAEKYRRRLKQLQRQMGLSVTASDCGEDEFHEEFSENDADPEDPKMPYFHLVDVSDDSEEDT